MMQISLNSVTKTFDGLVALDSVTLGFKAGRVCVIAGPNGAGKTTLLRIIAGLMRPDGGEVVFGGSAKKLGCMMEESYLYRDLTPRENLNLYASLYGKGAKRVDEVAGLLNIFDFMEHEVATLSHGQKQRVNLARTLISDPDILLLDEPFLGLDLASIGCVRKFLGDFGAKGGIALIATHEMDIVRPIANDLMVLEAGRVGYFGEFKLCPSISHS